VTFFAQISIRPRATASDATTRQCISSATDLAEVSVVQSLALTTEPRWKNIKVPIAFAPKPSTVIVWSQEMTVEDQDVPNRLYLRLVVHSDYLSSDLRFQLKYEGKYVADNQITAHGYADMIGPLDPGTYTVQLYYVSGTAASAAKTKDLKLCSMSMVDLRVASRTAYIMPHHSGSAVPREWHHLPFSRHIQMSRYCWTPSICCQAVGTTTSDFIFGKRGCFVCAHPLLTATSSWNCVQ